MINEGDYFWIYGDKGGYGWIESEPVQTYRQLFDCLSDITDDLSKKDWAAAPKVFYVCQVAKVFSSYDMARRIRGAIMMEHHIWNDLCWMSTIDFRKDFYRRMQSVIEEEVTIRPWFHYRVLGRYDIDTATFTSCEGFDKEDLIPWDEGITSSAEGEQPIGVCLASNGFLDYVEARTKERLCKEGELKDQVNCISYSTTEGDGTFTVSNLSPDCSQTHGINEGDYYGELPTE